MKILAIETSCDETAISVVDFIGDYPLLRQGSAGQASPTVDILAHEVISQIDMHKEWGGVVPSIAKREHLKNLPILLEKIKASTTYPLSTINLIAITYGPGLEPALWQGINFARDLANELKVPLVATDHMAGHIVSALLRQDENAKVKGLKSKVQVKTINYSLSTINFPAIALLVSGGHTELVLVKGWDESEIIGRTRDDAVGEAFDKVARILGLGYPGGPEISKLSEKFASNQMLDARCISLPRPMIHDDNFDFSFSGLKTSVLYKVKTKTNNGSAPLTEEQKQEFAYEFEQAVTDVLIKKTLKAIETHGAKTLIIGGGVIANKTIRERFAEKFDNSDVSLLLPDMKFVGDNATMIALAAYFRSHGGTKNLLQPGSKELDALRAMGTLALYQ